MRQLTKNIFIFAGNKVFPAFILTSSIAASVAQAAPQDGVVVSGQGTISTSANTTNINQQTGSMVVDWSSFNVNSNEVVNFNQPSASAAALNRIYDQNPSQIFGAINADGRVFLSNPNGIIFGQTATVNVGALMATSLSISNEDFMSGNYHFHSDGYTPGAIINRGLLNAASGGSISLVGGQVVNEGYVIADYGQIHLASGKQAILNFDGDGLISFQVSEDILANINDADSAVSNTGSLQANGGRILLQANVAKDIFTHAVNNEGMIAAHRLDNNGGEVTLVSNDVTTHSGVVDVYGENGSGGSVLILGDEVALSDNAYIEASGSKGGGSVLVGGDYQGSGDVQTAQFTTVDQGVVIDANSEERGDAGKVIIWSDDTTIFHGQINARAEGAQGNGGFAEVSGKQSLSVTGHADLTSQNGEIGELLLDPGTVSIIDGPDTAPTPAEVTGPPLVTSNTFTDGWINTQLASADVTITTATADPGLGATEDLIMDAAAAISWSAATDLELIGNASVDINGTITSTGSGGLTLTGGTVDIDNTISLATGNFSSSGTSFDSSGFTISSSSGNIDINHTGSVIVGTVNSTSGDFTSAGTSFSNSGATVSTGSGDITLTHSGDVDVGILNAGTGAVSITTSGGYIDEVDDTTARKIIGSSVNLSASGRVGSTSAGTNPALDIDTSSLTINTGSTMNIAVVSDDVATAKDLATLSITTDSDLGSNSDITAANLTFDVTDSGTTTTIAEVSDTTGLAFSFNNTAGNLVIDDGNNSNAAGISVGSGSVTLSSGGNITQSNDDIVAAGALTTVTNSGSTTLTGDNTITTFNGESTTGNIQVTDATGALVISGIKTTTGDTTIIANGGAISQTGAIETDVLTTTSTGGNTTLTNSGNKIASYSGTSVTSGDISVTDSDAGLIITGITSVGDVVLSVFDDLTQTGDIVANSGTGTLTATSSQGLINLNRSTNNVGKFNGVTSTSGENITIANTGNLDITGITTSGTADVSITVASGAITQTGTIAADLLTTSSTGGNTTLDLANEIASYSGSTTTSGNIVLLDNSGGLTLSSLNSAGTTTVTATTGSIGINDGAVVSQGNIVLTATAGAITDADAGSTTSITSTTGGATLTAATGIGSADAIEVSVSDLAVTNTGASGNISIVEANGTTVTALKQTNTSNTSGTISLVATAGDIGINDNAVVAQGGDISLTSTAGRIYDADAGTIASITNNGLASLTAALGIGVNPPAVDAIDTAVTSLYAETTGVTSNPIVIIDSGNTDITGIVSSGPVSITSGGTLTVSGALTATADIGLTADDMVIGDTINAIDVNLGTATAGTDIDIGVGGAGGVANTLELSAAELALITTSGTLRIGNVDSGAITITDVINSATSLHLISASTVTDSGNGAVTANTNLAVEAGGAVTLDGSNDVNTLAIDAGVNDALFVDTDDVTIGSVDSVPGITAANFDLTASDVSITNTVSVAGGIVTIRAANTNNVSLGVADAGTSTLDLVQSDINFINADTLRVVSTGTGVVDINGTMNFTSFTNLHLIGAAGVTNTAGVLSATNLAVTAGGTVDIGRLSDADVDTLAIDATGFNASFFDSDDVIVGDVDGVLGLTANLMDLTAGTSITGAGTITAQTLRLDYGATSDATLTATDSDIDFLETISGTKGKLTFIDVDDLTIRTTYTSGIDITAGGLLTIESSQGIRAIGTGNDFILRADKMAINGIIEADFNNVVLETVTANTLIDIGSTTDNALATLELSEAEIQHIAADTLTIGGSSSSGTTPAGSINITSVIDLADTFDPVLLFNGGVNNLHLKTDDAVTATAGSFWGDKNLAVTANSDVTFSTFSSDVNTVAIQTVGDVVFDAANDLIIGTVDGVVGVTGNNVTVTTANASFGGNLTIDSAVTADGSGDIILAINSHPSTSRYTMTANAAVSSTSGNITLTADDLVLNDTISSAGNLTIQPKNSGRDISVGLTNAQHLSLDAAELALLTDGFNSITIGDALMTDLVIIASATFNDPLTVYADRISVETLDAGTNDVSLNSSDFIYSNTAPGTVDNIIGGIVSLVVTNGDIGEAANPLYINAATEINADTSAAGGSIWINTFLDMPLGLLNAGGGVVTLDSTQAITDANGVNDNIIANDVTLNANTGIGDGDAIEIDAASLIVNNTGTGNIEITDANDLTLAVAANDTGDINIVANNNLVLGQTTFTTTNGGGITFLAGNEMSAIGTLTVDSAGDFVVNQAITAAGAVSIKTVDPLEVTRDITTTAGGITLDSSAITFSPGVVMTAANSIDILNAPVTGNGDLTLNANGIELTTDVTVNNGNLVLNAGNDDLSIQSAVTVNTGNLDIIATDLEIVPSGSITGTDTVTISDNGNGMELGGRVDAAKMNITLNEYELITAAELVLKTDSLTLTESSFQANTSLSPLTIDAKQMNVTQAGAVLGLLGDLDIGDTAVNAAADFTINVDGAFNMNNTIETNGAFALTAGQGVTMGEPSSITSNNNQIDITTTGGDILLGLADAGTANVNLTASAGSVLNNNGVFTNVLLSKININAFSTTITANQRIGASSTDAITINASPSGLITLDFNADKAFINNLQNTRIVNNGSGDVAVGLIFSGQIIGVGHNVGLNSQATEDVPQSEDTADSFMSVLGADYKLSAIDEEEEDSSTLNTVVPVMIRTKDGWEFKAPLRAPVNKKGQERKVDWL